MKKAPAFFYRSATGKEPVRDWLRALDVESRRIVGRDIATAEFGWPVGMPLCRSVGDGLHEIRSKIRGKRIARVIFVPHGGRLVLLHGFVKKTRKTPKSDLESCEATGQGDHGVSAKGRMGSSFEDFLKEEGVLEETHAIAVKRVLAWQLEQAMEEKQMSKRAMAAAMKTSRSQLDRILDPDNDRVRLDTLTAAAHVLGLTLRLELVEQ